MNRVYNFAPGPSMLATEVLEKVQKDLLCYGSTGMSVMEMSHRSKMYLEIFDKTVADFKDVYVVDALPKTRSGKVLRKTMRQIADGDAYSVPSTIEDPTVIEALVPLLRPDGGQ